MTTAIELLKTDHRNVRKLLGDLEDTTERAVAKRDELLARIGKELRAHGAIEEDIFYPALREAAKQEKDTEVLRLIAEAYEEHRAAVKLVLTDLESTSRDTVQFSGRAKVLKELVEHHADEEEKEMFKAARRLLDKDKLVALGAEMETRKQAVLESEKTSGRTKPTAAVAGRHGAAASD